MARFRGACRGLELLEAHLVIVGGVLGAAGRCHTGCGVAGKVGRHDNVAVMVVDGACRDGIHHSGLVVKNGTNTRAWIHNLCCTLLLRLGRSIMVSLELAVGIGPEPRRHPETVHLGVDQTYCLRYLLVVILLFEFFKDGFAFELTDVRAGPSYLVAYDTHEAQIVVSFARLAPLLVGAFGGVAQFALLVALVVVIGNFLLNRLIDVPVVLGMHGRAVVHHGLQPVHKLAKIEAQVAPLERKLR